MFPLFVYDRQSICPLTITIEIRAIEIKLIEKANQTFQYYIHTHWDSLEFINVNNSFCYKKEKSKDTIKRIIKNKTYMSTYILYKDINKLEYIDKLNLYIGFIAKIASTSDNLFWTRVAVFLSSFDMLSV